MNVSDKTTKVATYVGEMGGQLGKQFKTKNSELASLMASTLAHMALVTNPEGAIPQVEALIEARDHAEPSIEVWAYLCMTVNWLSWAWHENDEPELSTAWANAWHRIHEYSLENLKGDELKEYLRITD